MLATSRVKNNINIVGDGLLVLFLIVQNNQKSDTRGKKPQNKARVAE